jgi:hypothetical protein
MPCQAPATSQYPTPPISAISRMLTPSTKGSEGSCQGPVAQVALMALRGHGEGGQVHVLPGIKSQRLLWSAAESDLLCGMAYVSIAQGAHDADMPDKRLRLVDCWKFDPTTGKVVAQENFYDPRPALAPWSMGCTGQQTHPEVQQMMERSIKIITEAGRIAGCSCSDTRIPKFLGLGVQYFHSNVGRLLQQSGTAYLQTVRQAAANASSNIFASWRSAVSKPSVNQP